MANLINKIEDLMSTDDVNRNNQSKRLIAEYKSATEEEKKKVDDIFICLCGYSIKTLISKK